MASGSLTVHDATIKRSTAAVEGGAFLFGGEDAAVHLINATIEESTSRQQTGSIFAVVASRGDGPLFTATFTTFRQRMCDGTLFEQESSKSGPEPPMSSGFDSARITRLR
jgi:hypothetical protein